MRRAALIGVLLLPLVVFVGVAPASATTMPFQASFQTFGGASTAHPCLAFVVCGTGTVAGFGDATSTLDLIAFSFDPATGCGTATAEFVITLADGSTLTLLETGTICWPGAAGTAPGSLFHSFGNPVRLDFTFTVVDGTGVFEGLTGSGTMTGKLAGESGHITLSGTLDP